MSTFRLFVTVSLFLMLATNFAVASDSPPIPEVHVAVASNFALCFESLAEDFTRQTGIRVLASPGSTGRHFAQIKAGAPFQVFLAADALRPQLLEECGIAKSDSRFTYAVGRIVFWNPQAKCTLSGNDDNSELISMLTQDKIKHLALANPRLAPYGIAAQQMLDNLGLATKLKNKLVTGQNISQTWQFVASGNAEAGIVALSQVIRAEPKNWCLIPNSLHDPIFQQAVLLNGIKQDNQRNAAERLLQYLRSPAAKQIMTTFGYENYGEINQ